MYRFLGVAQDEAKEQEMSLLSRAGERMVSEGLCATVEDAVEMLRRDWDAKKGQFDSHAWEQFGSRCGHQCICAHVYIHPFIEVPFCSALGTRICVGVIWIPFSNPQTLDPKP